VLYRRSSRQTGICSRVLRDNGPSYVSAQLGSWLAERDSTLGTTPAVALGVTDHIWSVAELMSEALKIPPRPETPEPGLASRV